MPATLKDIASASGCSFQAVSAILRDRPGARFSAATRERVLHAAQQLGYRPNASALAMRAGRTGCVALLKGTHPNRNTLSAPVLGGVTAELNGRDLHLAILTLDDARLTSAEHLPKVLRQTMADGVLVKYDTQIPPQLGQLLAHFAIPTVWINSRQPADCVRPDDLAAGRLATEQLLALGHRRIAYVDFSGDPADRDEHYSCHDRHAGYLAAMAKARRAPQLIGGRSLHEERLTLAHELLRQADRPTAVVCHSGWSAFPLWHAALQLGLQIPRDLSLISFESQPQDQFGQELSLYEVPEHVMGRTAARLLGDLLSVEKNPAAGKSAPLPPIVLPFTCRPGQTVAPAPAPARAGKAS